MRRKNQRTCTRTQTWPDTLANITASAPGEKNRTEKLRADGKVRDIGSCGMFLETSTDLPIGSELRIELLFDPSSASSRLPVIARGVAVHSNGDGVGIRFTDIDLRVFQKAIVEKMNRVERQEKGMYTLPSYENDDRKAM
jgi:hypothetical protein